MTRILLVDDEALLVQSLQKRIERIDRAASIQATTDPREALRLARETAFDMVIVDVMMPHMNGIELIRAMKDEHIRAQFAVLSGYDDYAYVRQAFREEVVDYLLKPISQSDLEACLQKALARAEQARDEQHRLDHDAFGPLLSGAQEMPLGRWLEEARRREISVRLPGEAYGALLLLENTASGSRFMQRMTGRLAERGIDWAVYIDERESLWILLFGGEAAISRELPTLARGLSAAGAAAHMPIAHSRARRGLEGLHAALREAAEAMEGRLLSPGVPVLPYRAADETRFPLTRIQIQDLFDAQGEEALDRVQEMAQTWLNLPAMQGYGITAVERIYHYACNKLEQLQAQNADAAAARPALREFGTLEGVRGYILDRVREIRLRYAQREDVHIMDAAVRYVREHFDADIQMRDLADRLAINYTYFSELFKARTGMTFSAYLTALRMKRAQELLRDPTIPIAEVAARAGYGNSKHFARIFRQSSGMSPKAYRQGNAVVERMRDG